MPFARGVLLLDSHDSGLRLMAWPAYGVVKAEGRLAAILDGTRESTRLAARDELASADDAMRAQVGDLMSVQPRGGDPGVSRFDLTTERSFAGADGQDVLKAMRALCPPGYVVRSHRMEDGTVQSVAVLTERGRVVFRAYDKGLESGTHAPGERIRFEAQNRPRPEARRTPGQLASSDLRRQFGRTIQPFLRGESLTVTHPTGVVDQIAAQLASGDLTAARAERLIGSAELLRRHGRAIYADDRTSWRRLDALRRAGVATDEELPPGATVPVSELLREAVEEFAA